MVVRVVNINKEPCHIYIGRGSRWGNPYSHKEGTKAKFIVSSREEAILCYKKYLWGKVKSGEVNLDDLISLDNKVLGCYCKPKACHGDVIAQAIEWAKREKEKQNV